MKQTFTINGFDHHLLINDNERTLLIDTGSPFSIFNGSDFEFLGAHVSKGLLPVSPDTISDLLGTHVDALVGNDMLQQFSVLVDYSQGTITFSDEDLSLPGSQAITMGKSFGIRTAYSSIVYSLVTLLLERTVPMAAPMTSQPVLELMFAVGLPAFGAALLFDANASSGGTDVIAMLVKKYSHMNIGLALALADLVVAVGACFIF